MDVEELNSSELGTKEYWDKSYETEINNYKSHGDVGEVWFDEDSQIRVTNWIMKCDDIQDDDQIIDLGTGNGMMLVELAREGYTNLVGVDYSEKSIELSQSIAKDQELKITYIVTDLLSETKMKALGQFKVAHDKGTYDAISLNHNSKQRRDEFLKNVAGILSNDGYFLITSCNWTKDELKMSFEKYFVLFKEIPTPSFKFGGKVGNVVTSLVFKKVV